MRRHTVGGPLRDTRGPSTTARELRDAAQLTPNAPEVAAAMMRGLLLDTAQLLWTEPPNQALRGRP